MSEQAYTPRKCTKHDPYWETVYANCMACRAEKAEQQLQAIQATVGDTEFALRARVAELESKEIALKKHIELIQARLEHEVNRPAKLEDDIAQLQAALATVTAERDAVRVAKNDCVIELYRKLDVKDAQLSASQARCRELEADRSIKMNESRKFASYVVAHSSKKSARHNEHYAELIIMAERHLERAKDIPSTTPWLLEMMEVARRDKQELPQLLFQANETITQLQATLAAREAELHEAKVQRDNWKRTALGLRDDLQASLKDVRVEYGDDLA